MEAQGDRDELEARDWPRDDLESVLLALITEGVHLSVDGGSSRCTDTAIRDKALQHPWSPDFKRCPAIGLPSAVDQRKARCPDARRLFHSSRT